jgi:membrane protein required for colicin V production
MNMMNSLDYFFLVSFGLSVITGFSRGLLKEVFNIVGWVAACIVSTMFARQVAGAFSGVTGQAQSVLSASVSGQGAAIATQSLSYLALGGSFVALFLGTLMLSSLVASVVTGVASASGMGIFNRLLGAGFGCARGCILVTILIFLLQVTPVATQPAWGGSQIVTTFAPAVAMLSQIVTPEISLLKDKASGLSGVVTDQLQNVGTTLKSLSQ